MIWCRRPKRLATWKRVHDVRCPKALGQIQEGLCPIRHDRQGFARLMALAGQQGRPARFSERIDFRVSDEAKGLGGAAGALAAADGDFEMARAVGVGLYLNRRLASEGVHELTAVTVALKS